MQISTDPSYYVYYENVQGHLINMIVKPYQTSTSTALSADGEGVYTDHASTTLSTGLGNINPIFCKSKNTNT